MRKYSTIFVLFVVLVSFFIYGYKLNTSFVYHPDFSRDLYEIVKITQGKLTLIGPKLTFGGIYTAPYYFYLFVPVFLLTGGNILSVLYFNAFLFAVAVGYFFKKTYEVYSIGRTVLATLVLMLLPLILVASRDPYNSYSYIPFLVIFLTYIYYNQVKSRLPLFVLGLLFGVITNFHFVNFVLLPFILVVLFYTLKNRRYIFFFIVGFSLTFLPLLLFEARHSFVMFVNTFINKSYLSWVSNTNIPGGLEGKKNVIENILFMSEQMKPMVILNPLILLLVIGGFFVLQSRTLVLQSRIWRRPQKKELIFYVGSLLSLFLFALLMRFQFIPHYLFSIAFLLFFVSMLVVLKSRFYFLLVLFLLLEIIFFPKRPYQPSWRTPEPFGKAVKFVVANNLVQKDTHFNVVQITKQNLLATVGFEYRFFFQKLGFPPDSEFSYNSSQVLLVFSEMPEYDISNFSSWEVDQFGKEHFGKAQKYTADTITIYKVLK